MFPPAASAITSDVAQLRESFQAKSSQTAETRLKATTAPAPSLETAPAARKLTQSLNIAHATAGYKRRRNIGCFCVL